MAKRVKVKKVGSRVHLVNPDGSHGDRVDFQGRMKATASHWDHGEVHSISIDTLTKYGSVQDRHQKAVKKKKR